jgi:hypothetical protein
MSVLGAPVIHGQGEHSTCWPSRCSRCQTLWGTHVYLVTRMSGFEPPFSRVTGERVRPLHHTPLIPSGGAHQRKPMNSPRRVVVGITSYKDRYELPYNCTVQPYVAARHSFGQELSWLPSSDRTLGHRSRMCVTGQPYLPVIPPYQHSGVQPEWSIRDGSRTRIAQIESLVSLTIRRL